MAHGPTRQRYRRIAEETLGIFEAGGYSAIDGRWVDLTESLATAREGTVRIEPGRPDKGVPDTDAPPVVRFVSTDTLRAAEDLHAASVRRIALLNFASARSPGGGVLRGSTAQEESLCRGTTLYDALRRQERFYADNRAWPDSLYADDGLFSPDVMVIRDTWLNLRPDPFAVSVLTVPAPNVGAMSGPPSNARGHLVRRIDMMLRVALETRAEALVLGAWGCGVFGNDPWEVADLFDAALDRWRGPPQVLFAVPGRPGDPAFDAFSHRFASRA